MVECGAQRAVVGHLLRRLRMVLRSAFDDGLHTEDDLARGRASVELPITKYGAATAGSSAARSFVTTVVTICRTRPARAVSARKVATADWDSPTAFSRQKRSGGSRYCQSRFFHQPVYRTRCTYSRTYSRPAGQATESCARGSPFCNVDRTGSPLLTDRNYPPCRYFRSGLERQRVATHQRGSIVTMPSPDRRALLLATLGFAPCSNGTTASSASSSPGSPTGPGSATSLWA
jgi:hypothetical protein